MCRVIVLMQERVVIALHRIGSGNQLQTIRNIYEVYKSTLSKIIRKFCRVVRKHFSTNFYANPSESQLRV